MRDLWSVPEARRLVRDFLSSTSLVRANPALLDDLYSIIAQNSGSDDVEIYRALREFVDESEGVRDNLQGTFDPATWAARAQSRVNTITALLPRHIRPTRIVDVGSSEGSITTALGKHFGLEPEDIYALDVKLPDQDPEGLTFELVTPGDPLPFEDRSVSLITTTMVLHHIEDPLDTLEEIYRILRPGGYYVICEHDCITSDMYPEFLDVVHGLYATVLSDPIELEPEEFVRDYYSEYKTIAEWEDLVKSVGFIKVNHRRPKSPRDLMRRHCISFRKPFRG